MAIGTLHGNPKLPVLPRLPGIARGAKGPAVNTHPVLSGNSTSVPINPWPVGIKRGAK